MHVKLDREEMEEGTWVAYREEMKEGNEFAKQKERSKGPIRKLVKKTIHHIANF